ncbi:agmatine deiminase family protein, partial [Bacteroidales bacterium OttesenSCG-928-K03]|nr:agmatine deiminase family protein [Bacteroidales bacterium OttesenSCG-928-K03]
MNKKLLTLILFITTTFTLFSQPIYNKAGIRLYHTPSQEEIEWGKTQPPIFTVPTDAPVGELRPIAEYEPAEAVLISYTMSMYANGFGIPMTLIKEMAKDCKVLILVASSSVENTVRNLLTNAEVNINNCEFVYAITDSYWTRDYGPWFMAIDNQEVAMYDFTYNRPRYEDNKVNTTLAPYLGLERYASNIKHCGGNFMNDGTDQAISTVLVQTENPSYSETQLKQHFREYMGIEDYHFVEDALGDYIAHVDCWAKYLAPNKIMIGQVPESDDRYELYESIADFFASLVSPWGTPMQVYRVYTPGGSYYPTPYTNSLILNNKVFVALSGSSHDAAAIESYRAAMPGYEVIGINYNDWYDTDALHCRTHEIADRCMLYVKHLPFFGEKYNTGSITFSTEIYSYCDNTIYPDSVLIYLRTDGGEYEPYHMTYTENNTWEVEIDDLSDGLIEYYVFAADESGRRECHPYIGAPDPHKFTLITDTSLPILHLDKTLSSVTATDYEIVNDTIRITNLGETDLTYEITDIDFSEILSISLLNGTVEPDDFQEIILSYDFTTLAKETFTGSFMILSNDPNNPETEILLDAYFNYIGIDNIDRKETIIYPNPANDKINISFDG